MSPDAPDDTGALMARQLADIARVLLAPGTLTDTLTQIVLLAVSSIEGCDEAGLCETGGVPRAGSSVVASLDALQAELAEGPCVDTLGGLDSVYDGDLAESTRWPRFGPRAVDAGMRSALAFRLSAGAETLGALQLYARLPEAFNATDRTQGLIFAAHAGMALAVARSSADDRLRTENLQVAMVSREVIAQAQGILMERERITPGQAFDLLRRSSQHLNVKLRDVAQEIVDTGAVPGTEVRHPPSGGPA